FRALGLPAQVRGVRVPTDASDQPFDHEAVRGAINRAKAAIREGDLGVGIEAGLVWSPVLSDYFDVQYCAVVDRSGRLTVGHGPGFAYPAKVLEKVKAGSTVGEAMDRLTGIRGIGRWPARACRSNSSSCGRYAEADGIGFASVGAGGSHNLFSGDSVRFTGAPPVTAKIAINGYGTIGKRVADAVAAQDDMRV